MEEELVPLAEENLAEIQQKLKDDAEFATAFVADPADALASIGYYVPEKLLAQTNDIFRKEVAAAAEGIRSRLPEGTSRTIKVTVSLEETAGNREPSPEGLP